MKTRYLASVLFLCACVDPDPNDPGPWPGPDPNDPEAATISVVFDTPPEMVMVREGANGAWRAATPLTYTTFEAKVRQPYTIMGVCLEGTASLVTLDARSLEDTRLVNISCRYTFAVPPHRVSGSMVQPGVVVFNGGRKISTTPNWSFEYQVEPGIYDLVASDSERVAVQRYITVNGDTKLPVPVNLEQQGTPLVSSPFTVTNPIAGDTRHVGVFLTTPFLSPQAQIYLGELATAKVAPESVIFTREKQEVSVRSERNSDWSSSSHAMRRDFKVGDSTAFTLWHPFRTFTFPTAATPTASWQVQDGLGNLTIAISEDAGSLTTANFSKRYLEATRIESFSFDIEAPGFLPDWNADLRGAHTRELFIQDVTATEVKTRSLYEHSDHLGSSAASIEKAKTRATKQGRVY